MDSQQPAEGSWGRFHSFTGTMQRPNAPPKLTLSSPRSDRATYALDPTGFVPPRKPPLPQTAPLEGRGVPDLRLQPASTTTSEFPERSPGSLSRMSTNTSYESFSFRDRSGSSETVKGVPPTPAADSATIDTPSTQRSDADGERRPLRAGHSPFTQAGQNYGSFSDSRVPSTRTRLMPRSTTRRRMLPSMMHGVVLAIQGTVALAVFSALICVTIWQKSDSEQEFWNWLWTVAEPALAGEAFVCFAALLAHELRSGLSAVALLYVQSGILTYTTCTVLAVTAQSFGQESRAVKGALLGCDVMLWGTAFLGFARAVVVWRAEREGEEDGEMQQQRFCPGGTPWKQ